MGVLMGVGLVWRRIEGCFDGGWVSLEGDLRVFRGGLG